MERNERCWCGSGLKYKKCHLEADARLERLGTEGYCTPGRKLLKTEAQISGIAKSGRVNRAVLDFITPHISAGISTEALDRLIDRETRRLGGIPAPLNYCGFPKSCCISVNDVVCHGVPSPDILLEDGDIVNIDVSTVVGGFYSDSSRMFCVGGVSPENRRLVEAARACVELGVAQVRPWGFLGDMSAAIHHYALKNGYSVVEEIGGHGVGLCFHEEPWIGYTLQGGTGMLLVPGMVFTVEPMVNSGGPAVCTRPGDDWTVYTADGSPSAQWECTVLVTKDGCQILAD